MISSLTTERLQDVAGRWQSMQLINFLIDGGVSMSVIVSQTVGYSTGSGLLYNLCWSITLALYITISC